MTKILDQKDCAKSQKKISAKEVEEMTVQVYDDERLNDTIDEILFLSPDGALYDVEAIIGHLRAMDSLARIAMAVNGASSPEWTTCPHQRTEGSDVDYGEGDPASCDMCIVEKKIIRYLRNYRNFRPRSKRARRSIEAYAKNFVLPQCKAASKAESVQ